MSSVTPLGKSDSQASRVVSHVTPPASQLPVPDLQAAKVAQSTLSSPSEHSPIRNAHPPRPNVVYDPELHQICRDAKKLEWKLSLQGLVQAFQEVFTSCGPNPSLDDCKRVLDAPVLSRMDYLEARISRILQKLYLLSNTKFSEETVKSKASEIATTLTSNPRRLKVEHIKEQLIPFFKECKLEGNTFLLAEHANDLLAEISGTFYHPASFDVAVAVLEDDVSKVVELLHGASSVLESDPETRVKAILAALRNALTRTAYRLMRCDESHILIRTLHTLAIAAFANAETLPSYLKLGQAIHAKTAIPRIKSFGSLLDNTRETAANSGFKEDDPPNSFVSKLARVGQVATVAFNSVISGVGLFDSIDAARSHINAYFKEPYKDYRAYYGNNPGVYYEESFTRKQSDKVTMRVVISPSPAQGTYVLPEFSGLLQAIENRRLNPAANYPYNYFCLTYTNMQKRYEGSEGLQTNGLMQQNELYPLSFVGITLCVDPIRNAVKFDKTLMDKEIKNLLADSSFRLENKDVVDPSEYYFPPLAKETWVTILPQIVKKAYLLLNDAAITESEKIKIFRDVVNLGIVRYFETVVVSKCLLSDKGNRILSSRNCAAAVDRGMKLNNQLLYFLDSKATGITEVTIGRGLLAKDRLPLRRRTQETTLIAHHSSLNEKIQDYLLEVGKLASIDIYRGAITYPGCPNGLPQDPVTPSRRKLSYDGSGSVAL